MEKFTFENMNINFTLQYTTIDQRLNLYWILTQKKQDQILYENNKRNKINSTIDYNVSFTTSRHNISQNKA